MKAVERAVGQQGQNYGKKKDRSPSVSSIPSDLQLRGLFFFYFLPTFFYIFFLHPFLPLLSKSFCLARVHSNPNDFGFTHRLYTFRHPLVLHDIRSLRDPTATAILYATQDYFFEQRNCFLTFKSLRKNYVFKYILLFLVFFVY